MDSQKAKKRLLLYITAVVTLNVVLNIGAYVFHWWHP